MVTCEAPGAQMSERGPGALDESLPGDRTAVRAEEERRQAGDLVGRDEPTEGRVGRGRAGAAGVGQHRRIGRAGGDHVDGDATYGQFRGPGACERGQGGLGRGVLALAGYAVQTVPEASADDNAMF